MPEFLLAQHPYDTSYDTSAAQLLVSNLQVETLVAIWRSRGSYIVVPVYGLVYICVKSKNPSMGVWFSGITLH
jgi:hypothetical protein